MQDISKWLGRLDLVQYAPLFIENAIDLDVLSELNEADLEKLGVRLGHRKKMLRAISALAGPIPRPGSDIAPRTAEAERRQLTVMFCDLVGSTLLSTQLDPEDLRNLINQYHACCAEQVTRIGGYIAKYMGDGVLTYFGYPQAHEDDPVRAIRAGLAILREISRLLSEGGKTPEVRIGIATGMVVVGDLIGEGAARESNVVGETPNLAARLQSLAEPGTLVVAETTYLQAGRFFEYNDLGTVQLKGFPERVRAYEVLGASETESRFEAFHNKELPPLIGREEELQLLVRRWETARDGHGRTVLLSGEPGIGKSRVVIELEHQLSNEPHTRLNYYCSPHHSDTAFYPFINQLERAAKFERTDSATVKVEKLRTLVAGHDQNAETALSVLVDLLRLSVDGVSTGLPDDHYRKRTLTLTVLLQQLEILASNKPVLVVVEDAHWIDAASLELIDIAVERVRSLSVLLVITFRPEFAAPWLGQPHVTMVNLNRLDPQGVTSLILGVTGGKSLPLEVVDQILERTDGIPLFVEELTKSLLEGGFLRDQRNEYVLDRPLPSLSIPSSLHGSLVARLDRLGAAKEIAQTGAALGREFAYELLAATLQQSDDMLGAAVDQLIGAGLISQHGVLPHATFTFKHALIQDAAYSTMLRRPRQGLHARIAEVVIEKFPEMTKTNPEFVAHHMTEAALPERALIYWQKAGDWALKQSSYSEAVIHLAKARDLIQQLSASPQRDAQEFAVQVSLGAAMRAAVGYATSETAHAFSRARDLLGDDPRTSDRIVVDYFHFTVLFIRSELLHAIEVAKQCVVLAAGTNNTTASSVSHRLCAQCYLAMGRFLLAREHAQRALQLCEGIPHDVFDPIFQHHPPAAANSILSLTLPVLGYPDQAMQAAERAIDLAVESGSKLSISTCLFTRAQLSMDLGLDFNVALSHAEVAYQHAMENQVSQIAFTAQICKGIALTRSAEIIRGIEIIKSALEIGKTNNAMMLRAPHLGHLAVAYGRIGQIETGMQCLDEAGLVLKEFYQGYYEAELHRVRAQLLLSLRRTDQAEAELERAMSVAREEEARLLELRAAIDLGRVWRDRGKRAEAYDLIAPLYSWFTEGFGTPDLVDAGKLLVELSNDD